MLTGLELAAAAGPHTVAWLLRLLWLSYVLAFVGKFAIPPLVSLYASVALTPDALRRPSLDSLIRRLLVGLYVRPTAVPAT